MATTRKGELPGRDLLTLIRDYVLQETVDPLKSLGRTILYGLLGAVFVALGLALGLLGLLRVLQGETDSTFGGNWTFAPYLLTMLAGIVLVAGVAMRGLHGPRTRSHEARDERTDLERESSR